MQVLNTPVLILICAGVGMFALISVLGTLSGRYSLGSIRSKRTGDGQHGTARFANGRDLKTMYARIPFTPDLWRRDPSSRPVEKGILVGAEFTRKGVSALVDTGDVHALMIGAAGVGKTAYWLYPNLEYACASGVSFVTTDTKGDLARNYARIAERDYGYRVHILDLRNPDCSDGFNFLEPVNRYADRFEETGDLADLGRAEKYAKIVARTIILTGSGDSMVYGQNAFFYDAAEGLLTAAILMVSRFGGAGERHILSVYKLVQELLEPSDRKDMNRFQELIGYLPGDSKIRWFAGSALTASDQTMSSVISTALSRMNRFLDSELEPILCAQGSVDTERFCAERTALFLIMPEEDNTRYFMISLLLQELYREMLALSDEHGGRLPSRVLFYLDEFGTLPRIDSAEMMFSASRSRGMSFVPVIQSFAQLEKQYGKEGAEIIVDNIQLTLFGGFAPNSGSAARLSGSLGNATVQSGTVTRNGKEGSMSLSMLERPLLTPDELKQMPKGTFIVEKTGKPPLRMRLRLYTEWGIRLEPAPIPPKTALRARYVDYRELKARLKERYNRLFPTPAHIPEYKHGERKGQSGNEI